MSAPAQVTQLAVKGDLLTNILGFGFGVLISYIIAMILKAIVGNQILFGWFMIVYLIIIAVVYAGLKVSVKAMKGIAESFTLGAGMLYLLIAWLGLAAFGL